MMPRSLPVPSPLVAALSFLLAACSSSGGGSGAAAQSGAGGGGSASAEGGIAGNPDVLVGTFTVKLVAPVPAQGTTPETPGFTTIVGKVYDGPNPEGVIFEETGRGGDCVLTEPRIPFCSTSCGGTAVCAEEETCAPYPKAHSVGTVTVTGLTTTAGATEFTMSPIANGYQPPGTVKLPYPAAAEGALIRLDAEGGDYSAFTLESKSVLPLELAPGDLPMEGGKPLALAWTPGQAGVGTIHVKVDISHHGGTKGVIECDVADTGSLDVPASLVQRLLDLGVAGFPTVVVTRQTSGSAVIAPGRVDAKVTSTAEKALEIPGLESCNEDSQCGSGKTCRDDLTCG